MAGSNNALETIDNDVIIIKIVHPRLLSTEPEYIRNFLESYDQYDKEVIACARQLSTSLSDPTRPVEFYLRMDRNFMEPSI